MITYKVVVNGLDKLGDVAERDAINATYERTDRAMHLVVSTIERYLERAGSGRFYRSKRTDTNAKHQASAPGEPPAPDVFALFSSFSYQLGRVGKRIIAHIVSAEWEHGGRRLELGGYGGGSYIAPRPYIRPAMAETDDQVQRILDGKE